jgi:DNA helicase-2/ATP-dependent DNA helicase PcrA
VATIPKGITDSLNPEQTKALHCNKGPLLVLAGAGSGKTRVITHKFALLAKKYSTDNILALTFTNKAANEMKERIEALTKLDTKGCWVGTFHSVCNRILRREIHALGYGNGFTIYDEDDQCNLIRHILKEFKIFEAIYRGILSRISGLKSSSVSPEQFMSDGEGFGFEERLARVYVRYQDELKRCNAVDFDDLIMLTVKLFEEHPKVRAKYQGMFKYLLVDEFQDTNVAQYKLIKLLAAEHNNICAVGDDDQSIYAFRGATVKNILSFEEDFPEATIIKLEQNYRSTKPILAASGCVISENSARREKTLWCDREDGEKVCHYWFESDKDEAKHIAKVIREQYLKGAYDYGDIAVLYRTNLQSKVIEDAFRQLRISYRVVGGLSFYHRKEIKDMTAYMRLSLNTNDNVALRRIINVPARGVGASTITKIETHAKKNTISLYESIRQIVKSGSVTAATREKLQGFMELIDSMNTSTFKSAEDMLQTIYVKTGYSEYIEEDRAENVLELIDSASGRDVAEFMDSLSLVQVAEKEDTDGRVSLQTLHSAKGLEFPVVFISGLEEGILPYFKAKTPQEVDEERRLLYVGMTRARDLLWLTGAGKRRLYAKIQNQKRSRFLANIPDECCMKFEKLDKVALPKRGAPVRKIKAFKATCAYSIGARVKHPKWGIGVVRDFTGSGDDQKVTVNFPAIGVKRLALKFANLEKVI